jgi:MazG family protein
MESDSGFGPPKGPSPTAEAALARLFALMDCLLDPKRGCPWDLTRTTESLSEDFLEEAFELREAMRLNQAGGVLEEGGDVAFLLAFVARLSDKSWGFGLKEMLDGAVDKMVYRHPHVFGESQPLPDGEAVLSQWHRLKRQKSQSLLGSVPTGAPALLRCQRLASKAARSGFDWPDVASVRRALSDELAELDAEISLGDFKDLKRRARLSEELGDVLMAATNLARRLGFSAEKALAEANDRFTARFSYIEKKLAEKGLKPEDAEPMELERLWEEAKRS